ncbi:hypothetical protein B1C78_17050 [Thioalkalivibrio denitrificans]|uniref:Polysaccharide deacetylase n=1 Tax=Thioalkalivibrio denitrificans TaxID=108003 RepID=A0A1V3N6N7_9GAMM|nr:hypothetical protein [Thioalkalivibrio denitrificans]OOG20661.1 hypothetical protein B1C78_17050 [Thioalkalivibrio denitrificans]
MTPLTVHITVDTEFSVGDAFSNPQTGEPVGPDWVHCPVNGRSQGLGFLLDTMDAHGLSATFFVEALNTVYFGDEPMGRIARTLMDRRQDVQLHLHPFWLYFREPDWRRRLASIPPEDRTSGRSPESLAELIEAGLETFIRWGLPRPVAFRSGGLDVDGNVYRALKGCGLHIASNIGLGICEPADRSLHQIGGAHRFHGVVELPILTYHVASLGRTVQRKSLTITGSSWPEIRSLLWKARRAGYQQVVLLTHAFEFVKVSVSGEIVRENRINQSRFTRLCEFIAEHPDDFRSGLMRDVDPDRLSFDPVPPIGVSIWQASGRMVVNRLNDAVMRI